MGDSRSCWPGRWAVWVGAWKYPSHERPHPAALYHQPVLDTTGAPPSCYTSPDHLDRINCYLCIQVGMATEVWAGTILPGQHLMVLAARALAIPFKGNLYLDAPAEDPPATPTLTATYRDNWVHGTTLHLTLHEQHTTAVQTILRGKDGALLPDAQVKEAVRQHFREHQQRYMQECGSVLLQHAVRGASRDLVPFAFRRAGHFACLCDRERAIANAAAEQAYLHHRRASGLDGPQVAVAPATTTPSSNVLGRLPHDVVHIICGFLALRHTFATRNTWGHDGGEGPEVRIDEFVGEDCRAAVLLVHCSDVVVTRATLVADGRANRPRLQWTNNTDATRTTKPKVANMLFDGDDWRGMKGTCQFPSEGEIGFHTTACVTSDDTRATPTEPRAVQ